MKIECSSSYTDQFKLAWQKSGNQASRPLNGGTLEIIMIRSKSIRKNRQHNVNEHGGIDGLK